VITQIKKPTFSEFSKNRKTEVKIMSKIENMNSIEKLSEIIDRRKKLNGLRESIDSSIDYYDSLFEQVELLLSENLSITKIAALENSIFESSKEFGDLLCEEPSPVSAELVIQSDEKVSDDSSNNSTNQEHSQFFSGQLTLKEVLITYLASISPHRKSVKDIQNSLLKNGYKPVMTHFYASISSALRYSEKQNIFEKDSEFRWGLTAEYSKKIVAKAAKNLESDTSTKFLQVNFQKMKRKSISDCCKEILLKSDAENMHVADIIEKLNTEYKLITSKESISSILRRKALENKIFTNFGKNYFGLRKTIQNSVNESL
jgi:hypothetical protein